MHTHAKPFELLVNAVTSRVQNEFQLSQCMVNPVINNWHQHPTLANQSRGTRQTTGMETTLYFACAMHL